MKIGFTNSAFASITDILKSNSGTNASLGSVLSVVKGFVSLALDYAGILAAIMVLYSAFLYVSAFGEESKSESAKKTLYWALIGLAVIVLSSVIKNFVLKEASGK
ncbi:MAG: hypothetical protein NTW50_01460 [Candidatus Berkelbacteria bacterium]|nr:hypothetical protein [Candidatus Berkelbacteria bacterium]